MFTKRSKNDQDGDSFIEKISDNFRMNAYMCTFNEGEENSNKFKKLPNPFAKQ